MVYNLLLNGLWLTAPFPNARRCRLAGPAIEMLQRKNIRRLPCFNGAIIGHYGVIEILLLSRLKFLWCLPVLTDVGERTPVQSIPGMFQPQNVTQFMTAQIFQI